MLVTVFHLDISLLRFFLCHFCLFWHTKCRRVLKGHCQTAGNKLKKSIENNYWQFPTILHSLNVMSLSFSVNVLYPAYTISKKCEKIQNTPFQINKAYKTDLFCSVDSFVYYNRSICEKPELTLNCRAQKVVIIIVYCGFACL